MVRGLAASLFLCSALPALAQQEAYELQGADVLIRQTPKDPALRLLPPSIALAAKYGLKVRVTDLDGRELALKDLGKPTAHGPTMAAEGAGPFVIRAPFAQYVFETPVSPAAREEDAPLVAELERRVAEFVAAGPQGPVPREYGYVGGLVFWFHGETVSALAQSLPWLSPALQGKAKAFLAKEVEGRLLDEKQLAFERAGQAGLCTWGGNTATAGQALAALDDYVRFSGDLALAERLWPAAKRVFAEYNTVDWTYGCNPRSRLHVASGLLISDLNAQIGSAGAVARLARRLKAPDLETRAAGIAARLLITRYAYGVYVRPYLYEHGLTEVPSRKERGVLIDTLSARERWDKNAWPYDAPHTTIWPREMRFLPDGSNDPRVVVEPGDRKTYRIGMTPTGANHKGMVLHNPMPPGVGRFLGDVLADRTREIFDAFQANVPWWHWSDFETIIERGDETVASPDVSFAMYQTLAWALRGEETELRKRLPWEYLNVGFRDRHRLLNLGTYLRCRGGARWR
jgi:hypothetical protein